MIVPVCGTLPVPEIHLYHSDDVARRFFALHGFGDVEFEGGSGETIYAVGDCSRFIVVVLRVEPDSMIVGDLALLAHEAWHVTCSIFESMNEFEPGEETEACVLQSVFEQLAYAHLQWRHLNSDAFNEVD